MAIVTFCSNETKETGQTLSLAAVASYMAIEHNYKILIVSTNFNDLSLENCFWEYNKIRPTGAINDNQQKIGLESGIEGLIKVLNSNRTSTEIVKNYSRTVLKERLDILPSPIATTYQEYQETITYYADILQMANRYYDFVFVDLSKRMPDQEAKTIKQMSDVIIINLTQRLKTINDFMQLRETDTFYQRKNVMLAIGRYDRFSKYNNKNIMRYLKEKKPLSVIPYNTLFFESCSEGTIIDFLLKVRKLTDETDRNANFVKELHKIDDAILFKIQELQMKL
ncbi:MAG: hypothetical protein IJ777_02180 [Clostridia bacterium]|nr:hypothetical protein [Clostridia bacterium]